MANSPNDAASRRNEPKLKVQVWVYREKSAGTLDVLLLKLNPERGGYWQPVTGGVEKGEALEAAALREAQEETGLEFRDGPESLDYQFKFYSPRFERDCEEHVYALHAKEGGQVKLDPHEHVDSKWITAREAESKLKHPSNAEGLKRLLARKGRPS